MWLYQEAGHPSTWPGEGPGLEALVPPTSRAETEETFEPQEAQAWPPPPHLTILFVHSASCTSAALQLMPREEVGRLSLRATPDGAVTLKQKCQMPLCCISVLSVGATESLSAGASGIQITIFKKSGMLAQKGQCITGE